jgi:hypothetical protein
MNTARQITLTEALAAKTRWSAIPVAQVNENVVDEDPTCRYCMRMPRDGEDMRGVPTADQVRAIFASPWFWELAAAFPVNDILTPRMGTPRHYPDWFLLLVLCLAGVHGHGTIGSALTYFRSKRNWKTFLTDVDPYVPEGMTSAKDFPYRVHKVKGKDRPEVTQARPMTKRNSRTKPLQRNKHRHRRKVVLDLAPARQAPPPRAHHLDYWIGFWRGHDKQRKPLAPGHGYYGIRPLVLEAFRRNAVDQAQAMGVLDPGAKFFYRKADRNQFVGVDGVVHPTSKKRKSPSSALHSTGVGPVFGSKYTIFSVRVDGQYMSRVILDFKHTRKGLAGSANDEAAAIREIAPTLRDLARRKRRDHDSAEWETYPHSGMKGLLVDSVIRGRDVIDLHRDGIIVINYPHAASNPDGGPGKRLNPTRREKSALRTIATHLDTNGDPCEHPIYANGGELVQLLTAANGTDIIQVLPVVDYEVRQAAKKKTPPTGQRTGKPGTKTAARATARAAGKAAEQRSLNRREYLIVTVPCRSTSVNLDFTCRVPLFHTPDVSGDPEVNWGEVCRIYPVGSAEFKYLYSGRNDTEARHADLHRRTLHFPADVPGQELRLLGAALAINAVSWQVHLQAHSEDNVLDDTA